MCIIMAAMAAKKWRKYQAAAVMTCMASESMALAYVAYRNQRNGLARSMAAA